MGLLSFLKPLIGPYVDKIVKQVEAEKVSILAAALAAGGSGSTALASGLKTVLHKAEANYPWLALFGAGELDAIVDNEDAALEGQFGNDLPALWDAFDVLLKRVAVSLGG